MIRALTSDEQVIVKTMLFHRARVEQRINDVGALLAQLQQEHRNVSAELAHLDRLIAGAGATVDIETMTIVEDADSAVEESAESVRALHLKSE